MKLDELVYVYTPVTIVWCQFLFSPKKMHSSYTSRSRARFVLLLLLSCNISSAFSEVITADSKNCSQVGLIHENRHCDGPGKFPLKDSCVFYYECANDTASDAYKLVKVRCPEQEHFDGMDCIARNGTDADADGDSDCPLILCPVLGEFPNVPIIPENLDAGDDSDNTFHNVTVTNANDTRIVDNEDSSDNSDNSTIIDTDNKDGNSTDLPNYDDVMLGDDPAVINPRLGSYKYKADEVQENTKPDSGAEQKDHVVAVDQKPSPKPAASAGGHDDHHDDHDHKHGHRHGPRRRLANGGCSKGSFSTVYALCAFLFTMILSTSTF